jgi:hypothetical protein
MKNKHLQYVDFSNPNADKITTGVTNKPMINKKQTAVEWLVEELTLFETPKWVQEIIEKAKEMEKNQIEEAFAMGNDDISSAQYYNETFKSEQ